MTRYTYDEVRNFQIRAERAEKRLGEAVVMLHEGRWDTYNEDVAVAAFLDKIHAECEMKPDGRVVDREASRKCEAVCPWCEWRCPEPVGHPLAECFRCGCEKSRNP